MSTRAFLAVAATALGVGYDPDFDSGTYFPHRSDTRLSKLTHLDTPKPLSKRAKRRLRGKGKQHA